MSTSVALSFLLYVIINSFTPGPGNILALNTVTNYGIKKGRRMFLGIFAGYYAVQIICALFVYGLATFLPTALTILKYVGAAYLLVLAILIAISKPDISEEQGSASFLKGFLLQFVNVKIYFYGITALSGYIAPYYSSFWALLLAVLFIATFGSFATATWIGLGATIRNFYLKHFRIINIIMALTLGQCIWSILWG